MPLHRNYKQPSRFSYSPPPLLRHHRHYNQGCVCKTMDSMCFPDLKILRPLCIRLQGRTLNAATKVSALPISTMVGLYSLAVLVATGTLDYSVVPPEGFLEDIFPNWCHLRGFKVCLKLSRILFVVLQEYEIPRVL